MPMTPEDLPQGPGPNASMPFGEATAFRQANRAVQSAGTSDRNPQPGMPQGGQPMPGGPPQQGMPAPGPSGPVQPAPPAARGDKLDPSSVFSQWNGDGLSSMSRLEMWANHPSRPRVINMLVDRAKGQRDTATQ